MSSLSHGMCACDSGMITWKLFDARGIYIAYVCRLCESKVKARYRPEIFTDPNYSADEPIDEED